MCMALLGLTLVCSTKTFSDSAKAAFPKAPVSAKICGTRARVNAGQSTVKFRYPGGVTATWRMKGGSVVFNCSAVSRAISIGGRRFCFARERQIALEKSPSFRSGGTFNGMSSTFKSSFNRLATSSRITMSCSPFLFNYQEDAGKSHPSTQRSA